MLARVCLVSLDQRSQSKPAPWFIYRRMNRKSGVGCTHSHSQSFWPLERAESDITVPHRQQKALASTSVTAANIGLHGGWGTQTSTERIVVDAADEDQ
jgi:hypothetical protein